MQSSPNSVNSVNLEVKESNFPIFVVGYMHSGTTLLQNIIDSHPNLYTTKGESRFFHSLSWNKRRFPNLNSLETRKAFVEFLAKSITSGFTLAERGDDQSLAFFNLTPQDIDALLEHTQNFTTHEQFFKPTFDYFTKKHNKKRWLEKTAAHLFHVEKILNIVPNAQIIEIVRDPRDILGSKRARVLAKDKVGKRSRVSHHVKNWVVGFDPIWDSLAWKSAINIMNQSKTKHSHQVMRVRYEDLVHHPEKTAKEIYAFVNLDYSPSYLNVSWRNTVDDAQWKQVGISATAVGRWKKRLRPKDVIICQFINKEHMAHLGYAKASYPFSAHLIAPFAIINSVFELFLRLYRRYRLFGFSYIRTVFESYLIRLHNVSQ